MSIKMIAASAVLALAFTSGSAFAAGQFNTLDGVTAAPMTTDEMAQVVGTGSILIVSGDVREEPTVLFQGTSGADLNVFVRIIPGSQAFVCVGTGFCVVE